MEIGKLGQNIFSGNPATEGIKTKNLNDYLENKNKEEDKTNDFTMVNRPTEGMYNLEPIERYKYILNQSQASIKISQAQIDPEKSIKQANEVLNKAVLPPISDNPGSSEIAMAQLIKRMATSRLDLAA